MDEPTPAEELRQATATLRTNRRFGGISWVALAPPAVIESLAAWLESWDGFVIPAGSPNTEDYRSALTIARAITGGQP